MIWHKELGLVEERKVPLPRIPFNNHGNLVGVLLSYLLYISLSLGWWGVKAIKRLSVKVFTS